MNLKLLTLKASPSFSGIAIMLLTAPFFVFAQGSGNALQFNGTNSYVSLNTFPNQTTDFTVTAWIMTTDFNKSGQRIFADDEITYSGGYALSLGDPGPGRLRFYARNTSPVSLDVPYATYQIQNNVWYHVAAVASISTHTKYIYINGVLVASGTISGTWGTDVGTASIGGETDGGETAYRFKGQIDEVIFWNKALSQTEIRDAMCKKQNPADINILGYWNFDNASTGTNNVADLSGHNYSGTMTNMQATDVITSGAPLGDSSSYLYTTNWSGESINLPSASNGSLQVNNVSGNPDGIHIYRVDAVPNSTAGLAGLGNNNVYFGTFITGGSSPSYTALFDYANYPDAQVNEGSLVLNTRNDNSVSIWSNLFAAIDLSANTLTVTPVLTRNEFILTNSVLTLPIELVSLDAIPIDERIQLNWTTASENNCDYFTIEKSSDGETWIELMRVSCEGFSTSTINYSEWDDHPYQGTSYYRLRQTDFDGQFTYSEVKAVELNWDDYNIALFPNPATVQVTIPFATSAEHHVRVFGTNGQAQNIALSVDGNNVILNTSSLKAGVYVVRFENGSTMETRKIIVE